MHKLFAIEPDALDTWQETRYILEKFGFDKGALISRYPKKWLRMVYDACDKNEIGPIDKLRLEVILEGAKKNKLVKSGTSYDSDLNWLENTIGKLTDVERIITKLDHNNDRCASMNEVDENIFSNCRETEVRRVAKNLANAALYLLEGADKFILVDPYFQPRVQNIRVLEALCQVTGKDENTWGKVDIHCSYTKSGEEDPNILKVEYQKLLRAVGESRWECHIHRWEDSGLKGDLHERYLITDRGGLRYGRGFFEPREYVVRETLTDVLCIDVEKVKRIRNTFNKENDLLKLRDDFLVFDVKSSISGW